MWLERLDPGSTQRKESRVCVRTHRPLFPGSHVPSLVLQQCTTGTPLALRETTIHSGGMQIVTLDGYCFDASQFRPCNDTDAMLR